VIVIILPVGRRSMISVGPRRRPVHGADSSPADHRFQAKLSEVLHRHPYHPFKSDMVTDLYRFLAFITAAAGDKAFSDAFRVGISHFSDRLLRKGI